MNPLTDTEMGGGMRVQKFTFRKNQPLYVHTPLGTVVLQNVTRKDDREITIRMPKWMVASKKPPFEREDDVPTFVQEGKGTYQPSFEIMVPLKDAGKMVGVAVPDVLRITCPKQEKDDERKCNDNGKKAVADIADSSSSSGDVPD